MNPLFIEQNDRIRSDPMRIFQIDRQRTVKETFVDERSKIKDQCNKNTQHFQDDFRAFQDKIPPE